MNRTTKILTLLLLLMLLLAACDASNNEDPAGGNTGDAGAVDVPAGSDDEGLDAWLQQINAGEIETIRMDSDLDYGLGYFLYYGELESLGIDNLIYNALEVHRRLDTGEVTEGNLDGNQENLLEMAEGINYDPETELARQVAQGPEVREAILGRVVDSQQDLSPEEALESGEIVGVFGAPVPDAIGGKYLVFVQDSPDVEFRFLGVIMAVDAAGQNNQETYSFQGWENLPWLGDASGPFWDDLPTGVSGDPSNTNEGRPGVLLVSEEAYEEITGNSS